MTTRAKYGIFKPKNVADLSFLVVHPLHRALLATKEPKGFKSTTKNPYWLMEMESEMDALKPNDTWELVLHPTSSNVVGSKWVFRPKFHFDGSIERLKALLVAQGFTQILGQHYSLAFSHVVKAATVLIFLSLAVLHRRSLHQLDVKNAFLNGNLINTVFMEQPQFY